MKQDSYIPNLRCLAGIKPAKGFVFSKQSPRCPGAPHIYVTYGDDGSGREVTVEPAPVKRCPCGDWVLLEVVYGDTKADPNQ
jgi:hypothetical protein